MYMLEFSYIQLLLVCLVLDVLYFEQVCCQKGVVYLSDRDYCVEDVQMNGEFIGFVEV